MVLASIIGQHEDLRARICCFLLSCLGNGPGCQTFLGVAQVLRSVSSVNLPGSSPSGCRRAISGTSGTCAAILGVRSIAWVGVATVTVPNAGAAKPRMLEVADAAITGVHGAVFSCISEVRGKASATLCWSLEIPCATPSARGPSPRVSFACQKRPVILNQIATPPPTPPKRPGFRRARSFF